MTSMMEPLMGEGVPQELTLSQISMEFEQLATALEKDSSIYMTQRRILDRLLKLAREALSRLPDDQPHRDELVELVAAQEHYQWAHWTSYMLERLGLLDTPHQRDHPDVHRWKAKIKTPYVHLTDEEKEFDRDWARKMLDVVRSAGFGSTQAVVLAERAAEGDVLTEHASELARKVNRLTEALSDLVGNKDWREVQEAVGIIDRETAEQFLRWSRSEWTERELEDSP